MNKSLRKNLLREIRHSFGRFLAIFAIMALGSGFFAGLRVTKDALVEMGNTYLTAQAFFDYRLVSTLGFTDEDVDAFAHTNAVHTAAGSITQDVLFQSTDGGAQVIRMHSITENINLPALKAGRMPEAANECVIDARHTDDSVIGTTLTLSPENDETLLDCLSVTEFTVVGIVQSPYYLNHQRGTTSLGTGTVERFLYVPLQAFDQDYYTEIFLTLESTQGLKIYSQAYERAATEQETPLKSLLNTRAAVRYQDVVEDTRAEYFDAQEEYETEKADALQTLQNAYDDLKQAEADIVAGQQTLDDSDRDLQDAQRQLEDGTAQWEHGTAQLSAARAQLEPARQELESGWAEYDAAVAAYGTAAAAQIKAQLDRSQAEYDAALTQLEEQQAVLDRTQADLEAARREIEEGRAAYEDGLKDLEAARKEVNDGWREYYNSKSEAEQEFADAERELADAWADIQAIKRPTTYVLGRDTNIGYTSFDCDTSIMTSIARVFPFLFFLIAALVCITTMTRMVEENRTLIGTLKALGYGKGAIAGEFLLYSGTASLTGSISGFLLGSYALPRIIWSIYAAMYSITDVAFFFDKSLFFSTVIGYFLCAMAATWYVCRIELREVPAILMRPRAPKAGKRILLERVPFLWNRLGFLQKVAVRNVAQYKQRMLMMILGIGGCTALLVTGFGLYDSITDIVDYQFSEISTYDYLVTLNDPLTDDAVQEFRTDYDALLSDSTPVLSQAMDLTFRDTTKSVTALIPAENTLDGFLSLQYDGAPVPFPGIGEVVICENLAQLMGISIGDTVTVTDAELGELQLTVSGVMENYVMNYLFLSPESYGNQFGQSPEYNALLANIREGLDLYQTSAVLLEDDAIANVSLNADTAESINNSLSSMVYIVYIVIVCSGALAFIVLYNLTNININERIREIATIKVLGFYPRETGAYVTRESLMLTGMGAAAGLLAGKLLHSYVMAQVKLDTMFFPVIIKPMSYGYAVILTFIFAVLINAFMSLRLRKISMTESLKSIE